MKSPLILCFMHRISGAKCAVLTIRMLFFKSYKYYLSFSQSLCVVKNWNLLLLLITYLTVHPIPVANVQDSLNIFNLQLNSPILSSFLCRSIWLKIPEKTSVNFCKLNKMSDFFTRIVFLKANALTGILLQVICYKHNTQQHKLPTDVRIRHPRLGTEHTIEIPVDMTTTIEHKSI